MTSLSESERAEALSLLSESQSRAALYDWRGFWARPSQLEPGTDGAELSRKDWRYWLVQAGRGYGKTRVGAETIREWAREKLDGPIHLVAPTSADIRTVMVEGPSGLLSCYPPEQRPMYEPSRRRISWRNGNVAITFSADEPERLRGPQCEKFWADEVAAWRFADEAWDNLLFGFRLGEPRAVITTTPKPIKIMRMLISDPHTVVTRASSYENRANLAPAFFDSIIKKYEGTRIGRQELMAELLEDIPGALWTRALIDASRINLADVVWHALVRIVVAIDPAVTAGEHSDETGISVCGLTNTNHIVVLDDLSCRESPLVWAQIAVRAYKGRHADRIVGEVNNGGDLVEGNIRAIDPNVPFRAVHASRGKAVRAEPVAALYEQGRVHHVMSGVAAHDAALEKLEDQLCQFVPGSSERSPDRMDALVWAITDLIIDPAPVSQTVVWTDYEQTISPF